MNSDAIPSAPTAAPASLVPPYGNPGPEPLPTPWFGRGWPAGIGLMLAFVVVCLLMVLARRRRQAVIHGESAASSRIEGVAATDRDRFITCAAAIRTTLAERFGEAWRAKTTEEVAAALAQNESMDEALVERFAGFLHLADLEKFGGDRFDAAVERMSAQCGPVDPDAWCAEVMGGLAAGARSTSSGK